MATVVVPLGPASVNLTGIRAGDRNLINVTITSKDGPVNLTGLTVTSQARKKAVDVDPAITAVIEVLDAPNGEISLRWPGEDVTAALAGKVSWDGVWDLQVESSGEDPVTICAGAFNAVMDVTR